MLLILREIVENQIMSWRVIHSDTSDTLSGENIECTFLHIGAEPLSIKIRHPQYGWTGLLVNDGEENPDHNYWKRHAPFLFPIVGDINGGKSTTTDGKEIIMPGHGFARPSTFQIVDTGSDDEKCWIEYSLDTSMTTIEYSYPWECELRIKYTISAKELKTDITVNNLSDSTMYYQLGWHPGFKTPVLEGRRDRVEIQLPAGEYKHLAVTEECQLTGESQNIVIDKTFSCDEKEMEGTVIFDMENNRDRWCALYDPQSKIKTTVKFNDFPHLGLWAMENSPYICIEPWQGCDDHKEQLPFDQKFGIASLDAKASEHKNITLSIEY